jgi:hypothetical protein
MIDDQVKSPPTKEPASQALAAAAVVAVAFAQEQSRQMAAAAAVSAALMLQATAHAKFFPAPEASEPCRGSEVSEPCRGSGAVLSPWQLIMRSNQLAKKSRGSLR